MKDKICLITGANSGLGKATALELARLRAQVILACRDLRKGETALSEIRAATGNSSVELMLVDLSVQKSIREMVDDFNRKYDRLDVLVNNAGVYTAKRSLTPDGLETMFATNHLGPFLLTNLLLAKLKASPSARIITVTAPSTTKLDFDDLQGEKKFSSFGAFGASKMGNLLFTYALAHQLEGTNVTANALHPGLVKSNLLQQAPLFVRTIINLISTTPEKAAQGPVYLASSSQVEGVNGKFFKGQKTIDSSSYSHDQQIQQRLWDLSLKLTQNS
jgi:NAD(P)-dependent dehydrogenase (short-subunit alcohol dehydrogenase family)